MTIDIKDFYLNTNLTKFEYMKLPASILPPVIINKYQLANKFDNNFIHIEIQKGMYGLPQAGIIAHKQLITHLATHGYHPTVHTPGLWKHSHQRIHFTLVVDDFGVKYINKDNADHLLTALQQLYTSHC